VAAAAGKESGFTVQATDLFDSDQLALQAVTSILLQLYPEAGDAKFYHINGDSVTRSQNGKFKVKYTQVNSVFR
jgi:hypothetical protein